MNVIDEYERPQNPSTEYGYCGCTSNFVTRTTYVHSIPSVSVSSDGGMVQRWSEVEGMETLATEQLSHT